MPTNCPLASICMLWQACKFPTPVSELVNMSFMPVSLCPSFLFPESLLGTHKLTVATHKSYLLEFYVYCTLFFFTWPVRLCTIILRVLLAGKCIYLFPLWPSTAQLPSSLFSCSPGDGFELFLVFVQDFTTTCHGLIHSRVALLPSSKRRGM